MTPETSVSIALLISLTSLACTLINTFAGGKKRQEEQAEREKNRQMDIEKNFVKINVKLDEFYSTSKKMMAENSEYTCSHTHLNHSSCNTISSNLTYN